MIPKSKTIFAAVVAVAAAAPHVSAAHSPGLRSAAGASSFESVLPPLPKDMPWLNTNRRDVPKKPLLVPDAGTVRAWMFRPEPGWAPSPVLRQSAGTEPAVAGL